MTEEKKKKKQIAVLVGCAIVIGAIGYYIYSSQKPEEKPEDIESKQSPNTNNSIEQITYAGDDSITNKIDENNIQNKYESKSEEDSDNEPIQTNIINDEPISSENNINNNEIKEEEEPEQNDTNPMTLEEKEPIKKESEISISPKEESPVIINKTDISESPKEIEEPIAVVIKQENENENEEKETENKEMKALIQKYDNIGDIVSKYKTLKYKHGKLTIKIINIINVDKSDDEKNEVLIKLNLPEQKEERTDVKENNNNNIEFNNQFTLLVNDTLKDVLIVSIENNEKEIGKVEINVIDIVASKDQCVDNKEFEVIGSKSGCKVYLNLIYFEDI